MNRAKWSWRTPAGVIMAGATLLALAIPTSLARPRPAHRSGGPAEASVSFSHRGHAMPRGFFGITLEYNELARYEAAGAAFDQLLSLIRPRDGGSLSLRLGGKSADHAIWDPARAPGRGYAIPSKLPHARGVFALTPEWLADLAALVRRDHLRVTLDLNLAVHSPALETRFAKAVRRALPRGALVSITVGNEPDDYHYQPTLQAERIATTTPSTPLRWWQNYTATDYRRDFTAYARAVRAALPGIPLGAPETSSANPAWLATLTGLKSLTPSVLAIHRYASSTCFSPRSPWYPKIGLLLNDRVTTGLAGSVISAAAFSRSHRMSLRLSEVNSVSCGNDAGVADTFATALWAPDALFEMLDAGVSGVNWEIRPRNPNTPFGLLGTAIIPLPELYGLAVFARMTHGPATLFSGSPSGGVNLKAWMVRKGADWSILVINKDARAVRVSLAARGPRASIRRLLAPSVKAKSGVTFAGQTIAASGRWHGRQRISTVRAAHRHYEVYLPAYSAALLSP